MTLPPHTASSPLPSTSLFPPPSPLFSLFFTFLSLSSHLFFLPPTSFPPILHPQAACGDILSTGRKPGKASPVLLHARGLHWAGETGKLPARKPPTTHSKLHQERILMSFLVKGGRKKSFQDHVHSSSAPSFNSLLWGLFRLAPCKMILAT